MGNAFDRTEAAADQFEIDVRQVASLKKPGPISVSSANPMSVQVPCG